MNEEEIFIAALDLSPSRRQEFLAETCGEDDALRQRIELLLQASSSNNTWIDEPAYTADGLLEAPERIGRYQITGTRGEGGFGVVYSAYDEQLDRSVAIKVPHVQFFKSSEVTEAQLAEARTVAGLDHPNIVPVYDVGGDAEFPFYIVSKLIDGSDLKKRNRQAPLTIDESIQMLATIAKALHYAHTRGVIHRDVKPGNILLGRADQPFLVDFGLALQEKHAQKTARYSGSPAYMSPEQARGEGHRVDRRCDIFSLCVVMYELLTGQKPFAGESQSDVLQNIALCKPLPLRELDSNIPRELERMCLKGLSLRASDRYFTAQELAADLQHFLDHTPTETFADRADSTGSNASSLTSRTAWNRASVSIVPKGLRSFDRHDAEFFLNLLPGPRDYQGLPDSIRFWKSRIESPEADESFAVGILYGPAGCGKSSLVKAGLLPQLSSRISTIYLEASSSGTESGLLRRLHRRFQHLPATSNLKETLSALRRGNGLAGDGKVLIVLDQFEQWLHARGEVQNEELVSALRQCDGERVMCLILVRDEFWLSLSRFMMALEIDIVPSRNAALVDLFDLEHGRYVLAAYGRALGRLPLDGTKPSEEQRELLRKAVDGLAIGQHVIPVRIALFAEMMKGRSWTPEALDEVGGMQGLGVTLLEEAFSATTADPRSRRHQASIRAVLQALLPDAGSDIKGEMKSYDELLAVSGYGSRPKDFAELVRILDTEFRLITPINRDNDEPDACGNAPEQVQPRAKEQCEVAAQDAIRVDRISSNCHYQLAHDYLVHSVRDWLNRKQRETHSGRAKLLLAERAAYWEETQDAKFFPGWLDWAKIACLTKHENWTSPQRRMMKTAGKKHLLRFSALLSVMAILSFGALSLVRGKYAESLRAMRAEKDLQRNLYFAEMNLASQESTLPNAIGNYLTRWTPANTGVDLRGWEWYYLSSRIHRGRLAIENLGGRVRNVVWNRDETRVAAAVEGSGVVIWDSQTGEKLHTIKAESVWNFDWSPDGKWIAVAELFGSITVWDGDSFELSRTLLEQVKDSVPSVSWSSDSKQLATGFFESGKICIWNIETGKELTSIATGSQRMSQVAWSPDGRSLASTDNGKYLKVWDANSGEQLFEIKNQTISDQPVDTWTLCWSPDASRIATGSTDGVIRIWDIAKKREIATLKSNGGVVVCVSWHAHLPRLVSGHQDHLVRVWNLTNSKLEREFRGHAAQVRRVAYNPKGTELATAGYDGSLRIWEMDEDDQNQFLSTPEHVHSIDWSSDGQLLASGGNGVNAFVWDTKSGDRVEVPLHIKGNLPLAAVRWSPDGNLLAASKVMSEDTRAIQIWNKTTGEVRELEGRDGFVNRLSWNVDGTRLAAGGTIGEIAIWDTDKLGSLESVDAHQGNIQQVQWNPSGTLLASGGDDGYVKVWNTNPLTLVWQWKRPSGLVNSLGWSPSGTEIAAVGDDGLVTLLDAETGSGILEFGEPTEGNECVDWSPDGDQIVTGSVYGILRIWDVSTGKMTTSLKSQIQNCREVCWHPDGKKIASCGTFPQGNDGIIQIWDASIGYRREQGPASSKSKGTFSGQGAH